MTKEKLSKEFFAQEVEALGSEAMQLIYAEIVERLIEDIPDADMLDSMLIERTAFLYVHIRHKETKKTFAHDRAYKETLQLWMQLAAQMQKKRSSEVSLEDMRDRIVNAVQIAVYDASKILPKDQQKAFQAAFLEELEGASI